MTFVPQKHVTIPGNPIRKYCDEETNEPTSSLLWKMTLSAAVEPYQRFPAPDGICIIPKLYTSHNPIVANQVNDS